MKAITVETFVMCNKLILISAGRPEEDGFTRRLIENYKDVSPTNSSLKFEHYEISNAEELRSRLASLAIECKGGARPIIHLDMHGSKEHGVQIGRSKEFIGWP